MTKSPRAMPEVDRAAANRAAIEARRARAAVKAKLRSGELSPLKALADAQTPGVPVGTIRVIDFLQTFPSIGETKAAKLLEQLRISPRKRLGGLGVHQLERLEDFVRQRAGVSAVSNKTPLTVLAGPTAVGKGTVASHVRQHYPHIQHSVSVTTRPARPGEIHGVHYLFVDDETFDRLLAQDELLEWATVHNSHRYGTPKGPVLEASARGESMLLEIDLQGARQVRANMPDARLVFLAPPSWEELVTRLVGRGTEGAEERTRRLETAKVELAAADEFDVVIVNDEVAHAAAQLVALILGEEDGSYSPQM